MSDKKRILAMGAHPDDIELEAGGTLLSWAESGHELYGLVLSSGAYTDLEGQTYPADERRKEMDAAAKVMGFKKLINLGYEDTQIPAGGNIIRQVDNIISDLKPEILISHHPFDSHQDHRIAAEIMFSVARQGRIETVLSCAPLPYRPNVFAFRPQFFSDITSSMDKKIEAIKCYQTQYKKYGGEEWITRIKAMAMFWGWAVNVKYAECFEIIRQNQLFNLD